MEAAAISTGGEPLLQALSDAVAELAEMASDRQRLVEGVSERAERLLKARCVTYLLSEGGGGWSSPPPDHRPLPALQADDPTVLQVLRTGRPRGVRLALADGAALPSVLAPLRSSKHSWGVLHLARPEPGASELSESDILLAQHLALAAAMSLEHGSALADSQRELTARQRMAERLRVLAGASRDFSAATSDYRALLRVVAQTAGRELGEICSIRLVSADGLWLREEDAGIFHPDPEIVEAFKQLMLREPQPASAGLAGTALASGQPLLFSAVESIELFPHVLPSYRPLLARLDIVHVLIVPLLTRGRAVGVLSLSRRRGAPAYADDDLRLAQDLADRAGLAIENAMLFTDLEQRVRQNEKAEQTFRGLLESAPDAIVIIDADGKIVLINAETEELFGYSRAELIGQSVELLVPSSHRRQHASLRAGYVKTPRIRHARGAGVDLSGMKKDGTEFPAEISLSPIETPEGPRVTAVIRDITERKRLEEARARGLELETANQRAQEANRLKSQFLANMSHELRTPLNAIIGFSSLLHAGKVGKLSETQVEYLGDILVSSRHLLQLINDVLDLAKIEAGKTEPQIEVVDLARVASEVRNILRGLAAEKRVQLAIDVAPELGSVSADARLLKQILYNYLSNAIKFTPEHGQVWVRIKPASETSFMIEVEDTGVGIHAHDLEHLFVEFQQLDSSGVKQYPGSGLGLALTKRIVEAQGGKVGVVSVAGKGSTFTAELPRRLIPSQGRG